jgi:uncharacterized repeat protein (TIGR03803 family)
MKNITRLTILVSICLLGSYAQTISAQTLTNLYEFGNAGPTDGAFPLAGLVQGTNGLFYGTTEIGGTNSFGTVFQITTAGTLTILYQFGGLPTDGHNPFAGLTQGFDGNFYGTATIGGISGTNGTVFQITPAGTLTTLHQFGGSASDGLDPTAALVQGVDSNFYGTTLTGGTNSFGTVFQITTAGTLTTLHQFGGLASDGHSPFAGLVQGSDGNFYGTTSFGGTNGDGTVFQITSAGTFTTLYQFGGVTTDGHTPNAGLVQGTDGNFYGTTSAGGTNGNGGTVFQITTAGTLTTLYHFGGLVTDGTFLEAGLMQAIDGDFYGTTSAGGTNSSSGTLFKITSAGTLTTLHQFGDTPSDGIAPHAGLIQGTDGKFYGTTDDGGVGFGTVFQFDTGCLYALSPTNAESFTAAGGTGSVGVTATNGCDWTAVSQNGFITITSGSPGSGNGTFNYSVAANLSTVTQAGSITVAGQTYTVTEAGIACSVSPDTTSASFSAAGGSSNIFITANGTNCTWTAVSNSSFIDVTAGNSGSGNGVVSYDVAANTNTFSQAGSITVAGQTFIIIEAPLSCNVTPAATTASFSAAGGSSNIVITANGTNCIWTAVSNNGFILITGGSIGSGNGVVSYSVAANTNTIGQSGSITVGGQTYTVTEAAVACVVAPTATSASFSRTGGSSNIVITANGTNCTWTAVSNDGFITITAGGSGSGNGTVNYTVATNTSTVVQTGSITVAGQTYTITEAALSCSVAPASTTANFGAEGGASNVVITANGTNCVWTAVSHSSFITITAGGSGSGDGTVSYTVAPNTIPFDESGSMAIAGQTFRVTQAAGVSPDCRFTLGPTTIHLPFKGGTKTVKVKSRGTDCEWSAASNDSFIMITSATSGTGNGTVHYTVPGNTNATPLSGTMTIAGQTVTINQDAGGCIYSFSPKNGKLKAAGGPGIIKVKPSLNDCAWTAVSNDPFITVLGNTSGVGKGSVGYAVSANTNTTTLTGSITIGGQTYTVTQAGVK